MNNLLPLRTFVYEKLQDGMVVGVGTGRTVEFVLEGIPEFVKERGFDISFVPTSFRTAEMLKDLGLEILSLPLSPRSIDFGFDGADQVDSSKRAIKGKGGALLLEKIVASLCREFVLIVDESKLVDRLGKDCPVPIEVIPEAVSFAMESLKDFGAESAIIRMSTAGSHGPVFTEKGNIIIDAEFGVIPPHFENTLKTIVGVVESGLFLTQVFTVAVSTSKGGLKLLR